MKRGAFVGMIVGAVFGVVLGVCIVWIGLIFDDSPDGVAPLIMFGLFSAAMSVGFFAAVGAVIGGIAKAIAKT